MAVLHRSVLALIAPSVIRILTTAWAEIGRFSMELLGGTSIFSISAPSEAATDKLLEHGPWSVMGCSFSLHPWLWIVILMIYLCIKFHFGSRYMVYNVAI
ncbi:hypothetical protein M0R45_016417 [Rubus argutus]|uniref:Uncharacterized protein n=1 Tax=Rubus argutus TaxID=59490 RepID=A0AAW1XSP7_RUBAR